MAAARRSSAADPAGPRFTLLEELDIDGALDLLKKAAALCKKLGDRALAARVDALQGATLVEESWEPWREKGFVRMERALRRAVKLEDASAVLEISETLAYLQAWWRTSREALQTMEAAADFCARKGAWAPPRLGQLLWLYRALAAPSRETTTPLVDEVIELMSRGDITWLASLDYLEHLDRSMEEKSFLALLAAIVGEDNAESLSIITIHGQKEDEARLDDMSVRRRLLKQQREIGRCLEVGG